MTAPNGLLNSSGGMKPGQTFNDFGQQWAKQNNVQGYNANTGGADLINGRPANVQPGNPNQDAEIASAQGNINSQGMTETQARAQFGGEAIDNALSKGIKFSAGTTPASVQTQPADGLASSDTSSNSNFSNGRDSAYNQATSRLDPQWGNAQHDLEEQLTQQGIMRNSDAWNRATDDFGRNKNDAYSSAWNNAWNNGLASQNQGFTQDFSNRSLAQQGSLANRGYDLQSQNQTWSQGFQDKGQNFNQDLATKQFDYGKEKDLKNIATSSDNATKNGLFGLGAAALTNPNTLNLLKGLGGGLLDAAGTITDAGKSYLKSVGIGGGSGNQNLSVGSNADGSTGANNSGIYSDGQGGYIDGDGNPITAGGSSYGEANTSGIYPDGQGGYIDGDGNPVDENGNPI